MALAVFDIDGTLVRGLGTESRLFAGLFRSGFIRTPQLLAFLAFGRRHAAEYGRHTMKKNKAYLSGLECTAVEQWALAWVQRVAPTWWYEPAVRRLQQHRAAGDRIVLLSGTPQFLAEGIASVLAAGRNPPQVIGTRIAAADGHYLPAPPIVHPFLETKRQIVEDLCAEQGMPLAEVHAYADSAYDMALLQVVGHPVAVRPDTVLRHAAQTAGWEILGKR